MVTRARKSDIDCRVASTPGSVPSSSAGDHVLENGRQQHVDLSCSFMSSTMEEEQLDIKWYFENEVSTHIK